MENIYIILFDRIIQGKYPPETWLREIELAREFSVSRAQVRKHLNQLEQDKLIEILPKRGARVFPFNADDIEEIFEIRKSLEILAITLAAPSISINGLVKLRGMITNHTESLDYHKYAEIDETFHKYFIEASSKRRLISMLHQLYRLTQHFRDLGFKDKVIIKTANEEHINIIDALCQRDVEQATELLEIHLQNSKIRIINKLLKGI